MKKKILFVIPEYSHGGTNKSLEHLLHFIDKGKYSVSILCLYEDGGKLYREIFHPYIIRKSLLYRLAHDNVVTRKVMGLLMKLNHNVTFNWLYLFEARRVQTKFHYDVAIAFQEGTATQFVSYMDKVEKRIAWIHCDYKNHIIGKEPELDLYKKFDRVVSVSQCAVKSVINLMPTLKVKTSCIYNTIDVDEVERKSLQGGNPYSDKNVFKILSVGRFVYEKQFYLIPDFVKELRQLTSHPFCWFIIGDGLNRKATEEKVKAYGLEKEIKILGQKENPYPYFRYADLHVCPSASESFSYTIAESKTLHVPVLCNDFPVSTEVVSPDEGWICNVKNMPDMLARLLDDENHMYSKVKASLANYKYPNEGILKAIDDIL